MHGELRIKRRRATVDWASVEVAYYQGRNHAELCKQFGCSPSALTKQILRKGWATKRDAANPAVPDISSAPVMAEDMEQGSRKVRAAVSREIQKLLEALESIPAGRSLQKLRSRAEITQKLVTSASTIYAWENKPPSTVIDLAQLKSARRPGAIDVEMQPVAETSPAPALKAPSPGETGG